MGNHRANATPPGSPPAWVLILCAGLLIGGYAVALLRGPLPPQEVRVIVMPAEVPGPGNPPSAE